MIGKTISHYKIIEKIGEGGMGIVYWAEDIKLKRDAAIKFLPQRISADADERKRFEIEAQAAALNHPNIATIHAIEEADDEVFIVMEYIDGKELTDIIASPAGAGFKPALTTEDIFAIAAQIADGLQEAHDHNIVHRDIKPANIMITTKGRPRIMDFGLAKVAQDTLVTKAGSTLGTAAYMSPEQALGEPVDHRADIWSFGVVLYEMIAGQRPFKGEYEQAIIYAITNQDAPALADLRPDVSPVPVNIVNKMLARNPDERYQHTSDILADLQTLYLKCRVN